MVLEGCTISPVKIDDGGAARVVDQGDMLVAEANQVFGADVAGFVMIGDYGVRSGPRDHPIYLNERDTRLLESADATLIPERVVEDSWREDPLTSGFISVST